MWGVGVWGVGWVSDGGQKVPRKTFRGFGTERARLGTFKKNLKKWWFFTQKEQKLR